MDAFSAVPPAWITSAVHSVNFRCPGCGAGAREAKAAWINRRSPVTGEDRRRKWQEFYHCECDRAWWGWSGDRPPADPKRSTG